MSDQEEPFASRSDLEALQKHLREQDAEIFRLSQRVDSLVQALQIQKLQIEALAQNSTAGADTMPADEKPPHY